MKLTNSKRLDPLERGFLIITSDIVDQSSAASQIELERIRAEMASRHGSRRGAYLILDSDD